MQFFNKYHKRFMADNKDFAQKLINHLDFEEGRDGPYRDSKDYSVVKIVDEFFKFILVKEYLGDYTAELTLPSPEIDRVWHIALLYTRDYQKMCGDTFFHHEPFLFENLDKAVRYNKTLETYRILFGEPEKTIFPDWDTNNQMYPGVIITNNPLVMTSSQYNSKPESDSLVLEC